MPDIQDAKMLMMLKRGSKLVRGRMIIRQLRRAKVLLHSVSVAASVKALVLSIYRSSKSSGNAQVYLNKGTFE